MFFGQLKIAIRTLRFRLMLWNAVVMLIASLGILWGLREGVRYTLLSELDSALRDDFGEISFSLVNQYANDKTLHGQITRKARGHVQRSWFVQFVDMKDSVLLNSATEPIGSTAPTVEHDSQMAPAESKASGDSSSGDSSPSDSSPSDSSSGDSSSGDSSSVDVSSSASSAERVVHGDREELGVAELNEVELISPQLTTFETVAAARPPRIIWQTFNVPDWSLLSVPPAFDKFILPDGIPTTVDHFRVVEHTVFNARGGPVRVRIGASVRSIEHASETTDRLMFLTVIVALVLAPLGGYYLALRATKPLNVMIRTTDRLRPQQMDERLPIRHTQDELDQLSEAFNRLLDRIAEYLTKRQDLLANSAHELRTPLAALRSTAELALGADRTAAEYRELLELIVSECGSLELLVNQLLLLSETESAHFESRGETVDLSKITSEACDMFGAVAESRGVTLQMSVKDGVMVDGSRLHLRQLLNNLIDNAIKFIPGQGKVTVELSSSEEGKSLVVRDTGIGIAPEEQQRLFERFYRGDRARRRNTPTRGTGLGLSICRAIAEAHGGTITIQSQPGVGTAVTVLLPRPSGQPSSS